MKLKLGDYYRIEDLVIKYTGKDYASGGVGRFNATKYSVYCFDSSVGELRIRKDDLKELTPATKLHKLLEGIE